MVIRRLELESALCRCRWIDESLRRNISRLAEGRPSSSRVKHAEESSFSRERCPSSKGFESTFSNGDIFINFAAA